MNRPIGSIDISDRLREVNGWSPATVTAYSRNGKFIPPAGRLNRRVLWWWEADVDRWIKEARR